MFKFLLQLLLEAILTIVLFFNVFVSKNMNNTLVLIGVIIFLILSILVNGYKKARFRSTGDTTFIIFGLSTVLVIGMYLTGFIGGFSNNPDLFLNRSLNSWVWISTLLIAGISEVARYVLSQIHYRKKLYKYINWIFIIVLFSMIDMSITTKIYDLTKFNQFYEFFALVFVQSVAKNIFLLYVTKNNGYKPCWVYRIIVDFYVFYIPVIPNMNMLLESVALLLFPYIVYVVLQGLSLRVKIEPARKNKKVDNILTLISAIVFGILVALVSREFRYCMIGVGSGSMTGTINKGDAIVYEKFDEEEETCDVGDIIVFRKNNVLIVHRVIKRVSTGSNYVYQTQGDANEAADSWVVKPEDVVGKVRGRVVYIAWPSILINEIFK